MRVWVFLVAVTAFAQPPTVIQPADEVSGSRAVINTNFANLYSESAYDGPSVFRCANTFRYQNLNSCLDAAKAYATTNNTGSGNAATIVLPSGTYSLAGPYTLISGMQIYGTFPRFVNIPNASPDYSLAPNGGTWIDCGAATCFTGAPLTSVILENIGFKNFTGYIGDFGTTDVIGMSESVIRNVFGIGNTPCCGSNGFRFYNPQNIDIYNVHVINCNSCMTFISDNSSRWGTGNSNAYNLFLKGYSRSVANGNNAVPLLNISAVNLDSLSLMQFNGLTQVQAPGGDGTGTLISCAGNSGVSGVNNSTFQALDLEGVLLNGLSLTNACNNMEAHFNSVQGAGITNGLNIDATSNFNTFYSASPQTFVNIAAGNITNIFYGMYKTTCNPLVMQGNFFCGGFLSATGNAYVNQGLWLQSYNTATSGTNYPGATLNVLSSLWNGAAAAGDLWSLAPAPAAGASPRNNITWTHAGSASSGTMLLQPPTLFGSGGTIGFDGSGNLGKGPGSTFQVPAGNGEIILQAAGVTGTNPAVSVGTAANPMIIDGNGKVAVQGASSYAVGASTSLSANLAHLTPTVFASAPACSAGANAGTIWAFTDSTTQVWGATITGSGALPAIGYCDGSAWSVMAK